ncbi:uncharacterized protein UV8b_00554 [Ustilaginoidea virens]|uniref:Uncharacterized protein n=1 Tax=Ustilaginoidea virens TaxID=1159556 RepID=A0A1B5L9Q8_USTVR|nr:uncharacterized protein UV8b_00554 [Ustilaginoidea virens]QUC16313.1 hypothetical protein UV8b_00554 [Ustilaginoidea virens]GAO19548.1 hypothetical protein UVI_02014580 [Ustilaginoidea virens]
MKAAALLAASCAGLGLAAPLTQLLTQDGAPHMSSLQQAVLPRAFLDDKLPGDDTDSKRLHTPGKANAAALLSDRPLLLPSRTPVGKKGPLTKVPLQKSPPNKTPLDAPEDPKKRPGPPLTTPVTPERPGQQPPQQDTTKSSQSMMSGFGKQPVLTRCQRCIRTLCFQVPCSLHVPARHHERKERKKYKFVKPKDRKGSRE